MVFGSDLSGMLVVDDLEHEREEGDEDLVAVLQIEAHVERLDVGQVLKKVEVPLEGRIFWVPEASKLLDEEVEDDLDLLGRLVGGLGGEDAQDVGNTASHKELDVPGK